MTQETSRTPELVPACETSFCSGLRAGPMPIFFGLQVADVATTLIFRSTGAAETNPVASYFMEHFGVLAGLLLLKIGAISIGLACKMTAHPGFVKRINGFYCVIVLLNLLTICGRIRA